MSDSRLVEIRTQLAAVLAAATGVPFARSVPATARAGSGYIRPQLGTTYLDFTAGAATFKRPALNLAAVLIAPTGDWIGANDWIDEQVTNIATALDAVKTLPNGVQRPMIAAIGPPGLLDVGTSLLAVELTFTPIFTGGFIA